MTKASNSGIRFLMTRVAVGGGSVATLLALWGGIAVSAAKTDAATSDEEFEEVLALAPAAVAEPVLAAAAPIAEPSSASEPGVIVVERQPIIYVTEYVTLPATEGSTTTEASPSVTSPSGGNSPSQAAAAAPTPAVVVARPDPAVPMPVAPTPVPVIPALPPAPVLPPVATVAPAPPAPPPKPAATAKKSKGS